MDYSFLRQEMSGCEFVIHLAALTHVWPRRNSKVNDVNIDNKYLAQKYLLEKHQESGLPVVIVNPTYMIGPYDSGPPSGNILIALYENNIPGFSTGGKNFVCSQDVASAAINAMSLGRLGECYIAGNVNLEFYEFLMLASEVMQKKFTGKKVPQVLILLGLQRN